MFIVTCEQFKCSEHVPSTCKSSAAQFQCRSRLKQATTSHDASPSAAFKKSRYQPTRAASSTPAKPQPAPVKEATNNSAPRRARGRPERRREAATTPTPADWQPTSNREARRPYHIAPGVPRPGQNVHGALVAPQSSDQARRELARQRDEQTLGKW